MKIGFLLNVFKATFAPSSLQFVKSPAPEGRADASDITFCGTEFYKPPVGLLDGHEERRRMHLRGPDSLVSHLAFYFGSAHGRVLVFYCAPSALVLWMQIEDTLSKSHPLHLCFYVCMFAGYMWCLVYVPAFTCVGASAALLMSDAACSVLAVASS